MALKSQEDPLTGLFNRRGLETSICLYPVKEGPFIVMLIDLDGFKSVNDTYGHKVGDDLLVAIAQRIRQVSPERSVLARIGGDEFVLVYPEPPAKIEAGLVAARIIGSLTAHYEGILSVEIGACVGICRLERLDPVEMLLRADFALYAAKKRGRNEYYFSRSGFSTSGSASKASSAICASQSKPGRCKPISSRWWNSPVGA